MPAKDQTFTQKLNRLEEIVAKLESPDVDLEDGLKLLEEGVALHRDCQHMLTQTQAKITQLLDATKPDVPSSQPTETHAAEPEQVEVAELFSTTDFSSSDDEANAGLPF